MDIKMLSVEEWNSHPAVEVSFLGNKKDTPSYRLEAGWYHGDLGLPILNDGSVCIDAFRWLHRTKYTQFLETLKSIELPHPDNTKVIEIMQKNDCFIFYGSYVYYHFIVDWLGTLQIPALSSALLNRSIVINKSLPSKYKEFLLEILKTHGCEEPNFIPTAFTFFPFKDSFIQAHPSNTKKIDNVQYLASKIDVVPIPDLRRIFVLRGSTQRRNLLNEQELASMLVKDFGFSVINPGKLSIRDQIRCFKNANIIAGVHGGGLTNALFANNLQVLIEIFNSKTRSHLPFISKQLGAKHFHLKVDPVETLNKQVICLEDDKNMTINLQSAKKFFRLLFAGKLDSLVVSQACLIDLTSAK